MCRSPVNNLFIIYVFFLCLPVVINEVSQAARDGDANEYPADVDIDDIPRL